MAEMMLSIKRTCPLCGREQTIMVRQYAYMKWVHKELSLQEAMPELTADEREALLSGICPPCWDKRFKEA